MGLGAGLQTELARVADCAGEEMESSVWRAPFSREFSWHIAVGTRWLLEALPGIEELCSVLLCAWSSAVEIIIVAGISTMNALDTGDGEERAHTWRPCISR